MFNIKPMLMKSKFLILCLFFCLILFFPISSFAEIQTLDTSAFKNEFVYKKQMGLYTLGTWALTNIGLGTYGYYNSSGQNKYFHQMNVFWNFVNIGLAGYGLANSYGSELAFDGLLDEKLNLENVLLINAGLDVLYIGSGVFMKYKNWNKNQDRFIGYGNSLILQGSFLLVFDLGFRELLKTVENPILQNTQLMFSPNSFSLNFYF